MSTRISSGGSSQGTFARLAALAVGKKTAEEDEDMKNKKADPEDGDDDEEAKDEEDDPKSEDKKDDEDAKEEDDDGEDNEEEKGKKAKVKSKSKKAEDKKDDDEDDEKARAAERRRIAAILTCDAAYASEQNFHSALNFALLTDMASAHAIAVLSAMPVASVLQKKTNAARDRIEKTPNPKVSSEGDSSVSLADRIILAGKKRRGEV